MADAPITANERIPDQPAVETDEAILKEAKERFKLADEADADQRELRREDTKFALGDSDNMYQWEPEMLAIRQLVGQPARPCITDNRLLGQMRQVTNDQRQNKPQIKVRAVRDGSKDVAEVLDGIIRHIEDVSDAAAAYSCAGDHQVAGGLGYFRILTEYVDSTSFDQEIKIQRIPNPDAVRIDPFCKQLDGSDMNYAFIFDEIQKETYEKLYPHAVPGAGGWDAVEPGWLDLRGAVRVAEYFRIKEIKIKLARMMDGSIVPDPDPAQYPETYIVETRTAIERTVQWFKCSSFAIIDRRVIESQFIPICRVIGEEWIVDGERIIRGAVRPAKDPQRLVNYWTSTEAEMIALQPKSPFVGYDGQITGHEDAWNSANTLPVPFLPVNPIVDPVSGQVLPLPQRQPPPMMPSAFTQGKMGAIDALKASTGQYDASLGQRSNETSGVAIRQRETQGDTATFHYQDGLARAMRYGARIILDMLPRVYKTRQATRIIGEDGTDKIVRLQWADSPPVSRVPDGKGGTVQAFNVASGLYDVTADVGPGYQTKRLESADLMTKLAQSDPTFMQKAGDIVVRKFDMPGGAELSDRLKKFLPPNVLEGEGDQNDPAQVIQQMRGQIQQMEQALQNANQIVDHLKQEADKNHIEMAKLQTETFKAQSEAQSKVNAAQTERDKAFLSGHMDGERLTFERDKASAEAQLKVHQMELDEQRAELDKDKAAVEVAIKQVELEIKNAELEIRKLELQGAAMEPEGDEAAPTDGKAPTAKPKAAAAKTDPAVRALLSSVTAKLEALQTSVSLIQNAERSEPAQAQQMPQPQPIIVNVGGRKLVNLELVRDQDGRATGVTPQYEQDQGQA